MYIKSLHLVYSKISRHYNIFVIAIDQLKLCINDSHYLCDRSKKRFYVAYNTYTHSGGVFNALIYSFLEC